MSPEKAWPHIKALWTDAECVLKKKAPVISDLIVRGPEIKEAVALEHCEIDWPDGVDRWPPPEPQYREPHMPEDWGREIEMSDDGITWFNLTLCGKLLSEFDDGKWVDSHGEKWPYARIRVDDDGWKPMESVPKDREVWAIMGGEKVKATWCRTTWCNNRPMWISRLEGRSLAWDRDNQPTAWKEIE